LVHTSYSLKVKIYINRFLRSINWFVGSGDLVMNILQIHRSLVQSQTAPEQKESITIYQAIRNQKTDEKWNFNLNFCAVYDLVSLFLQERAFHVFGKQISILIPCTYQVNR
jgi:hypothetical protein